MSNFTLFWETYPIQLCNRKGSKKKAQEIWEKIPESEYGKILTNMRELARADIKCKQMGGKRSDWIWPMVTTWLNGERWNDITDLKQSAELEKLAKPICACGNPVEVVNQCGGCYDKTHELPFAQELRDSFRKNAIKPAEGQSVADAHRQWWHEKSRLGGIQLAGKE